MSYFNFDDILASQERLPLKTLAPVIGCAFLAPSASQQAHSDDEDENNEGGMNPNSTQSVEDLRVGVKMELPLWMVQSLLRAKVSVELGVPPIFTLERRPILRADPVSLNLPKVGPKHFYRVGAMLLRYVFDRDESNALEFQRHYNITKPFMSGGKIELISTSILIGAKLVRID